MKKLLALLMACATMTCAFASCGDDEADSSSTSSESSVSESSEDKTEEDTTEEDTTEEDTTEEDTAEADALEDSEETTAEIERTTYEFIEDADMTAFVGKWEGEKIVMEGGEVTDLMGIPLYAVYQIEVKDDGTAVMGESANDISESEEDVSITCEWGVVSDTEMAVIDETGNYMLFTLDGDYLVFSEEGYDEQIYFRNVEEFTPFDYEAFMAEFQEGLEEAGDGEWITDDETDGESDESVAPEEVDTKSVDDTAETTEAVAE